MLRCTRVPACAHGKCLLCSALLCSAPVPPIHQLLGGDHLRMYFQNSWVLDVLAPINATDLQEDARRHVSSVQPGARTRRVELRAAVASSPHPGLQLQLEVSGDAAPTAGEYEGVLLRNRSVCLSVNLWVSSVVCHWPVFCCLLSVVCRLLCITGLLSVSVVCCLFACFSLAPDVFPCCASDLSCHICGPPFVNDLSRYFHRVCCPEELIDADVTYDII